MPIDPDKFNAAKAKRDGMKAAMATPSPSPAPTLSNPTSPPAAAPKVYELPADKLMAFLQAHVGKNLDLAQVKQQFGLTDTAVDKLVQKFKEKGVIEKDSGLVDATVVGQINWPAGTIVKIEEDPTFTYGELLEFIKTQTGTPIEKTSLINRFGMTAMKAEAVVEDIHAVKLVDAQGVILPLPQIEEVIKKELGHINLDAPYSFHTPSVSTPTSSPSAMPVMPPPPVPANPPAAPAVTSSNPITAPAAPLNPTTASHSASPATAPAPAAAPAAPSSPNPTKIKAMVDRVFSWVPPQHRNKAAIATLAAAAAVGGTFPWISQAMRGAPTSAPAPAAAPLPNATPVPAPNAQPAASAPAPQRAPATPETGALNPQYAESAWFKQLGEIKPVVEKILKTESAEEYGAPFFAQLKLEGQEKVINLSKESMVAVYKALDRGTLNTIAATPENNYTISCKVVAKDETTGITGTCYAHENLARIRKEIEDVLTRALNQGEWKMRPPRLFAQNTITETYAWLRSELVKKANEEAAKK